MRESDQNPKSLKLDFPSCEFEVRKALKQLACALEELGIGADVIGSAEVVLGEVLNNIVEHAYGSSAQGRIVMTLTLRVADLRFLVVDEGRALPMKELPHGILPRLDGPLEGLPEGGFGWYLVRKLATDLTYQRKAGHNELGFSILR